jgi:hypothetical protein
MTKVLLATLMLLSFLAQTDDRWMSIPQAPAILRMPAM